MIYELRYDPALKRRCDLSYIARCLKQKIGLITILSVFGLFSTASAEDITLIRFSDPSYDGSPAQSSTNTSAVKGLSLGISLERRQPSDLGNHYSKSALNDYDFRFRGMTTPEKADALDALKAAMDEFEVLHGVKDTFEETESKFERYIKKFMLKGEFDFTEEDEKESPEERPSTFDKRGKTSSFFYKLFVPDRIEWNLDASYSNRGVGGELYLGDYLSIRGDVGEETEAFMMFNIPF